MHDTNQTSGIPIPSGSLITVTFGRNVGTTPLTTTAWHLFKSDVRDHVTTLTRARETFGPFTGQGSWTDDGRVIHEDSVTFTFISGIPVWREHVDSILSELARDYEQDAIAWSYGPAMLARPRQTRRVDSAACETAGEHQLTARHRHAECPTI